MGVRSMLLGLLFLMATVLLVFGLIQWRTFGWQNWVFIASGITLVISIVIAFGILEMRKYKLEQVKFLTSVAEDFSSRERMYLEAWPTLRKYTEVPKEMDESEWNTVIHALRNCYGSVSFIFQVSQLVEKGLIDIDLLYLFYFDKITGYWSYELEDLIGWCGTGLDLAANYDSYEVARIVKAVRELVITLHRVHEKHGCALDGYTAIMERFDARVKDFLAEPARFDGCSESYVDNYVAVREWLW